MNLFDGVKSFLFEYFWLPIIDPTVHYNVYNTAVYAFLFGLAAIYLVFPMVKRLGLEFNRQFFIGISPFILLGGTLRGLRDITVLDTIFLETPFIYILMFVFTIVSLYISMKIDDLRSISYHKPFFLLGLTALITTLLFYRIENIQVLTTFIAISAVWIGAGYLFLRYFKPDLLNWSFTVPIAAHYFDATTTYVGITVAGAEEKHVLAAQVMDLVGASGIFLVKTAIIIPVVWIIYNDYEGERKNYYLFLVALLGFALATRNLLTTI